MTTDRGSCRPTGRPTASHRMTRGIATPTRRSEKPTSLEPPAVIAARACSLRSIATRPLGAPARAEGAAVDACLRVLLSQPERDPCLCIAVRGGRREINHPGDIRDLAPAAITRQRSEHEHRPQHRTRPLVVVPQRLHRRSHRLSVTHTGKQPRELRPTRSITDHARYLRIGQRDRHVLAHRPTRSPPRPTRELPLPPARSSRRGAKRSAICAARHAADCPVSAGIGVALHETGRHEGAYVAVDQCATRRHEKGDDEQQGKNISPCRLGCRPRADAAVRRSWGQPTCGIAHGGRERPDDVAAGWHCQTPACAQARPKGRAKANRW